MCWNQDLINNMNEISSAGLQSNRTKFIIGGLLFVTAMIVLVISATRSSAQFFLTVRELKETTKDLTGQNLRVSGAVLGESIEYNPENGLLQFKIAHVPGKDREIDALGGLELVLHQAVNDSQNPRLDVRYDGAKPDMLKDEAQVILTGKLDGQGVFIAEELLLKCPSRYQEALPEQVE